MADEGTKKVAVAPQQSVFKDFVAGGAGGVCLVITGQPLDTIKVIWILQHVLHTGGLLC